MTNQQVIDKLFAIEAQSRTTAEEAARLRKQLESGNSPATPRGRGISIEEKNNLKTNRRKKILKKARLLND